MSIYSRDFPRLTHVQRDTLRMVSEGLSNSEIARVNFVSEKSFDISQNPAQNMRVLLTLAFLTGLEEVPV